MNIVSPVTDPVTSFAAAPATLAAATTLLGHLERGQHVSAATLRDAMETAFGASDSTGAWEGARGGIETVFPIFEAGNPVVVLPERIEDVAVVHQQPHRSRKALPDCPVDATLLVERDHLSEEVGKGGAFARLDGLELAFVGVSGVERDPQEDKFCVVVGPAGLGAADPADGAMDAQAHRLRKALADRALLGFQFRIGEARLCGHSASFLLPYGRAPKSLLRWFSTSVRSPSGAMTSTASPH